jgi:hypothetical protein
MASQRLQTDLQQRTINALGGSGVSATKMIATASAGATSFCAWGSESTVPEFAATED